MKVGVLTFHRCINFGSYWQARCLVEGLRALGHDAVLLDHDDDAVRRAEWRCALQPQLPVRHARPKIAHFAAKTRLFLDAFDHLPESPRFSLNHPEQAGTYDAVVIGSDEVWNFQHPWYGYKPIFFGDGLRTTRLISYAASFGNHDADRSIDADWAAKLARFDALSVRDENSRRLVRDAVGRDPALVLDPCLQFPPPAVDRRDVGSPYLALYGHGFPDWFETQIRRWADDNGRRVVSIGYYNRSAHEQRIDIDPDEFSALIAGADAVATNFFHGCVFAIHHRRPFIAAPSPYRSNKVRDLARQFDVEGRIVTRENSSSDYDRLLMDPIGPALDDHLATMRDHSRTYLACALG